jgi:hypothetical protein
MKEYGQSITYPPDVSPSKPGIIIALWTPFVASCYADGKSMFGKASNDI